jgi:hypothetical protein
MNFIWKSQAWRYISGADRYDFLIWARLEMLGCLEQLDLLDDESKSTDLYKGEYTKVMNRLSSYEAELVSYYNWDPKKHKK